MICANHHLNATGPFHNVGTQEQPRLVCHGCWTLGGLLHDKQLKADALDIFFGLAKTKREGRGKPRRPRRMWKP